MSTQEWMQEALAARLKARRLDSKLSQDQVAAAARDCGLEWYRETVAAIEKGKRTLSLAEFFLLPMVWSRAQGSMHPKMELADFLPEEGSVRLTWQSAMTADALRAEVEGRITDPDRHMFVDFDTPMHSRIKTGIQEGVRQWGVIDEHWRAAHGESTTPNLLREISRAADGEAERKAASRLGVTPFQVSLAAFYRHRQSLTSARDKMVAARVADAPPAVYGRRQLVRDGAEILPRTMQALRGHATRALVGGIADELKRSPWIMEIEEL
jgi:hypothetical protein